MNTPKPFDPTKPVATRDGRPARIICTDLKPDNGFPWPIAAAVLEDGSETIVRYFDDGVYGRCEKTSKQNPSDLVNVPCRTSKFSNVYANANPFGGVLYKTQEEALTSPNRSKNFKHVGVLELIYEDGEPVDVVFHKA